jgi:hypothetical protein
MDGLLGPAGAFVDIGWNDGIRDHSDPRQQIEPPRAGGSEDQAQEPPPASC